MALTTHRKGGEAWGSDPGTQISACGPDGSHECRVSRKCICFVQILASTACGRAGSTDADGTRDAAQERAHGFADDVDVESRVE
jgi:hypothetical protein